MISRYTGPEMQALWSDRNRYRVWLEVELAVCEELAALGKIPAHDWSELSTALRALLSEGGVDPEAVELQERVTRHDVIAFTTEVARRIGPISRYVHFGLTSSDVVDTALSLLLLRAGVLLLERLSELEGLLGELAERYRGLPTIGRSHGIHAEPTSFGLKFLGWREEWARNHVRLARALEGLRFGKLSGAVGVSPHWGPDFEERVLARLGLGREPVSTQVLPRDRHAEFLCVLAICGSSLERVAIELRHLQRSEVGEVLEGFGGGQKGSSAMPHKRNPIASENLTGVARLLRSHAQAALENVALWHERDLSHSSVERVILPDSTTILDYGLRRLVEVLRGLEVREDRVRANLGTAGKRVYSGHYLLALVERGVTREEAYAWIQECALLSLAGGGEFAGLLKAHPRISALLPAEEVDRLGSIEKQLAHVDAIFERAERRRETS
jgi:adenylosuccinate lyase